MRRECEVCGKEFVAQRSTARYCSSSCRARASTGAVVPIRRDDDAGASTADALVASVEARVLDAGLEGTPDGEGALMLARLLVKNDDGSKAAALYRQLTVALDRLDKLAPAPGLVDELRLRRDRKRAQGA